jgi:hypothetical protein
MNHERRIGAHLDTEKLLDYLDGRARAMDRREVEEHLGLPCPACRDLLHELGALIERTRLDRTDEVPEALRARALAAFTPRAAPALPGRVAEMLARILFDSLNQPIPLGVRRAVGEVRRLRLALGEHSLELEIEIETGETRSVRGRLDAPDPQLHRVELLIGAERLSAWADASGLFTFERVPRGTARITVVGPTGRYRVPRLAL